jgi:2-methylcitrate dehydratase PrpD
MNILEFIHDINWDHLPDEVQSQARRCLLDTLGAAIGGRQTELSRIICDFAAAVCGGQGAQLWLDGREVSPPGAALANGMTIDSLDIHDGYTLVKGHAGAALVPAVLATLSLNQKGTASGQALLASLVIGYEIALRAGLALHATACDYHTSGVWNALGCAAITARHLALDRTKTRHALGIAEYHGPRSQMMRCIDHPTMLKDGSGWGAMAGVSAGLLAGAGFTGAPALTVETPEVSAFWADLGQTWLTTEQYFKPQAVCRWAQPAIAGALALQQAHHLPLQTIRRIRITTFHEASRLACRRPQSTEEAQYSLPFSVAAALVYGHLGPVELSGTALTEPTVLSLSDRVELAEAPGFNARFPQERIARVQIETTTGDVLESGERQARWDAAAPPTDAELQEKFHWLVQGRIAEERGVEIEETVWHSADLPDAAVLITMLAAP